MGNVAIAQELAGSAELDELYKLDASESEPEHDEDEDEEEEDDEDEEKEGGGMPHG